jgi:glutaredoxin
MSKPSVLRNLWPLATILALVLGGNALLRLWQAGDQGQALRELAQPGDILMLSSTTCIFCTRAREWLTEQNVPFRECFIESDAACRAEFQARSGPGTPTFVVRGQTLVGFDPARLQRSLSR